jgi:hypothetical protein
VLVVLVVVVQETALREQQTLAVVVGVTLPQEALAVLALLSSVFLVH